MKRTEIDGLDVIRVLGLSAYGRHGVYPAERENGQSFSVDLTMYVDTRDAAVADDLDKTVDYSQVASDVARILDGQPVNLIETLAQRIAARVLTYPRIEAVDVEVHKPSAPLEVEFSDVSMRIRRWRGRPEVGEAAASAENGDGSVTRASVSREGSSARGAAENGDGPVTRASVSREASSARGAGENGDGPVTHGTRKSVAPSRAEGSPRRRRHAAPEASRAILALGGNLGDPAAAMAGAIVGLDEAPEVQVRAVSGLFRTAAVLGPEQDAQPDYFNAVIAVDTQLSARELLDAAHYLEQQAGRERRERWGARTLDIDLITYADLDIDEPGLTVPHPRAGERAFVLAPWLQIDPQASLSGRAVSELLEEAGQQRIECVADEWVEAALAGELAGELGEDGSEATSPSAVTPDVLGGDDAFSRRIIDPAEDDIYTAAPGSTLPTWEPGESGERTRRENETGDGERESMNNAGVRWHPRTPVLRHDLPEDYATGLLPVVEDEVRLSRTTVVRPAPTGAIPIRRRTRNGSDDAAD